MRGHGEEREAVGGMKGGKEREGDGGDSSTWDVDCFEWEECLVWKMQSKSHCLTFLALFSMMLYLS